jgi:nucleotide-binding universal stress UspA family protein
MYKDILLPVDLDQRSSWEQALPQAVKLCEMSSANLHVLTVVPDFGMSIVSQYFPKNFRKETMAKVMDQLKEFVEKNVPDGIPVQHVLGEGAVYDVILTIAKKIHADLIVMASDSPEHHHYLLGPNASRVVRHAECSVLVVRQ